MISPELVTYYEKELSYLREQGREFAQTHPKIAGQLGLTPAECQDPYVERLLEGVAFLTAKLNLKIEAEFPKFTDHLLELIAPDLLAPVPSMAIMQVQPDMNEGSLAEGFKLPIDSRLLSELLPGAQTRCEFRTRRALILWPIEVVGCSYVQNVESPLSEFVWAKKIKACLSLRVKTLHAKPWQELNLDELTFYLDVKNPLLDYLLHMLLQDDTCVGIVGDPDVKHKVIHLCGFGDQDALLPQKPGFFSGYRLLQEYFNFPSYFQFVSLTGLKNCLQRKQDDEIEIVIGMTEAVDDFAQLLPEHFKLHCVPAINLFPKECDRIVLRADHIEQHLVVDRSRPLDYEVHSVESVRGYREDQATELYPYYSHVQGFRGAEASVYTIARKPRRLSHKQQQQGHRTGYVGTEVFLQIGEGEVDLGTLPGLGFQQLGVSALCTNRDLPFKIQFGQYGTAFELIQNAPVLSVYPLVGPTSPQRSYVQQQSAWKALLYLGQNYLGLRVSQQKSALAQLKRLLSLQALPQSDSIRLVEGLVDFKSELTVTLDKSSFPPSLLRGIAIELTLDEECFRGHSLMIFGQVLSQLLTRFAETNAFTVLTLSTLQRGCIKQWPMELGQKGQIVF